MASARQIQANRANSPHSSFDSKASSFPFIDLATKTRDYDFKNEANFSADSKQEPINESTSCVSQVTHNA
jgi:hypothetical protein